MRLQPGYEMAGNSRCGVIKIDAWQMVSSVKIELRGACLGAPGTWDAKGVVHGLDRAY